MAVFLRARVANPAQSLIEGGVCNSGPPRWLLPGAPGRCSGTRAAVQAGAGGCSCSSAAAIRRCRVNCISGHLGSRGGTGRAESQGICIQVQAPDRVAALAIARCLSMETTGAWFLLQPDILQRPAGPVEKVVCADQECRSPRMPAEGRLTSGLGPAASASAPEPLVRAASGPGPEWRL